MLLAWLGLQQGWGVSFLTGGGSYSLIMGSLIVLEGGKAGIGSLIVLKILKLKVT